MKITSKTNFVRIFKIPHDYPRGFCFGGGKDVNFVMVDWFEPYPVMLPPFINKEEFSELSNFVPLYECPNQELEITPAFREQLNTRVSEFIRKKNYSDGHSLLAITSYGDAFVIQPTEGV